MRPVLFVASALILLGGPASAADKPDTKGNTAAKTTADTKADPKAGKALHDKHCVACHIQRWGGDGSAVYTRPEHKIKDLASLQQRVSFCSAQTGAKLFPDEEANIAAHLAQKYYKFP